MDFVEFAGPHKQQRTTTLPFTTTFLSLSYFGFMLYKILEFTTVHQLFKTNFIDDFGEGQNQIYVD